MIGLMRRGIEACQIDLDALGVLSVEYPCPADFPLIIIILLTSSSNSCHSYRGDRITYPKVHHEKNCPSMRNHIPVREDGLQTITLNFCQPVTLLKLHDVHIEFGQV